MVFRWFQRPFCSASEKQRTPAEKVAGDGAGRAGAAQTHLEKSAMSHGLSGALT